MDRTEYKVKINASGADNCQVMRTMADTMFNPYEIWNAAKAMRWTIRTGRISAMQERQFEGMTGEQTVDMVCDVAEQAEEINGAAASKVFVAMMLNY